MATRRSMSRLTKSAILAVTTKTRPSSALPLLSRSLSSSPSKSSVHYSFRRPQIQDALRSVASRSRLGSFSNTLSSLKIVRPFCSDGGDLFDVIISSLAESITEDDGTPVNFLKNLGDDHHFEADEPIAQIETDDDKEGDTVIEPGNNIAVDISKSDEDIKDVAPLEKIEEEEEEEEEEASQPSSTVEKVEEEEEIAAASQPSSTVEKVEEEEEEAAKVDAATAPAVEAPSPASPNEGSISSWMKEVVIDLIIGAAVLTFFGEAALLIGIVLTCVFLVGVVLDIAEFLKGAYQKYREKKLGKELHEACKSCSQHQVSPTPKTCNCACCHH